MIYGFFHGDLGSPSIPTDAYNGENVYKILNANADEFINSLRGVHRWSGEIRISKVYSDVRPFYFTSGNNKLISHLNQFIDEGLHSKIRQSTILETGNYQRKIADLVGGNTILSDKAIAKYATELTEKFIKLKNRGQISAGEVIIDDIPTQDESAKLSDEEP